MIVCDGLDRALAEVFDREFALSNGNESMYLKTTAGAIKSIFQDTN